MGRGIFRLPFPRSWTGSCSPNLLTLQGFSKDVWRRSRPIAPLGVRSPGTNPLRPPARAHCASGARPSQRHLTSGKDRDKFEPVFDFLAEIERVK